MKTPNEIIDILKDKKVLFVATKNCDYIRNSQEIKIIKKYAEKYSVVCFNDKLYIARIIKVYFSLLVKLIKEKYDVIFVGFAPQLLLPFYFLRFFGKTKIIITDFFISVYDTFVDDRKKIKDNSFIAKIMKWVDEKTLTNTDFAICDTNVHGDYFCKEFNFAGNKMLTLYIEADTSLYYPMDIARPEKIKSKFVVVYFGGMQNVHGVDIVLEAASILDNYENIFFYIIGPLKKEMVDKYLKFKNIEMIRWLEQKKLAEYISFADICLGGHFNGKIKKALNTIPGKVYIFKAMNKKVILGDTPANREVFEENDENIYVEPQNPLKLAEAIKKCVK